MHISGGHPLGRLEGRILSVAFEMQWDVGFIQRGADSQAVPRANRCMLSDHIYHLTHRCHNRAYLLRFETDRNEYRERLRVVVRMFRVSLLDYCITSNHHHLLVTAHSPGRISRLMQKLEGEFAEFYNRRKERCGAFWEDRYHCTMVEDGLHLWNCVRYIGLNMVRAGAVRHPSEWSWGGYHEIVGDRKRYRILDLELLLASLGVSDEASFKSQYEEMIARAIEERRLSREAIWTESIAVGSLPFVEGIATKLKRRRRLRKEEYERGSWCIR